MNDLITLISTGGRYPVLEWPYSLVLLGTEQPLLTLLLLSGILNTLLLNTHIAILYPVLSKICYLVCSSFFKVCICVYDIFILDNWYFYIFSPEVFLSGFILDFQNGTSASSASAVPYTWGNWQFLRQGIFSKINQCCSYSTSGYFVSGCYSSRNYNAIFTN